mmetsp:Transcript_59037/g.95426  ORF Transcript_59037/g.95426 Transcript_59037/m.95426 type:complete len:278 (-) Transcript_59037:26-859(-)
MALSGGSRQWRCQPRSHESHRSILSGLSPCLHLWQISAPTSESSSSSFPVAHPEVSEPCAQSLNCFALALARDGTIPEPLDAAPGRPHPRPLFTASLLLVAGFELSLFCPAAREAPLALFVGLGVRLSAFASLLPPAKLFCSRFEAPLPCATCSASLSCSLSSSPLKTAASAFSCFLDDAPGLRSAPFSAGLFAGRDAAEGADGRPRLAGFWTPASASNARLCCFTKKFVAIRARFPLPPPSISFALLPTIFLHLPSALSFDSFTENSPSLQATCFP